MKLQIDPNADALYLHLVDSPVVDSREVAPGVVLDYDSQNEVIGVEMLYLSKRNRKVSDALIEFDSLPAEVMAVHESSGTYPSAEKIEVRS